MQSGVTDKLCGPKVLEELLFRHHPVAMAHEIAQEFKDLGLQVTHPFLAAQLVALWLQFVISKSINHDLPPVWASS